MPVATEKATEVGAELGGALVGGVIEGVVVKLAAGMKGSTAKKAVTWVTLVGVPVVGIAAALMTKGLVSKLTEGVAAGGVGILGYTLPAMISPAAGATAGRGDGAKQLGTQGIKQLGAGQRSIAETAQNLQARVGLEF